MARRKYVAIQMMEDWGDGLARLWNPPLDFLPLIVRNIETEGGRGVLLAPHWPSQAWFARLIGLSSLLVVLGREHDGGWVMEGARALNPAWEMVLAGIGSKTTGCLYCVRWCWS